MDSRQGLVREHWLEQRKAELVPIEYFHVVFTLCLNPSPPSPSTTKKSSSTSSSEPLPGEPHVISGRTPYRDEQVSHPEWSLQNVTL